jgi:A/G-specific adenine glycosylase
MNVSKTIQKWYHENRRDLPWRNTSDPYKIWISEIILQQTKVKQGIGYYYKFIENFPDIFNLAKSPIDKVMKVWQGLGYYSRARNMHQTAQHIVDFYQGTFPADEEDLLKLKGIGKYTSAAVASIAFNKPFAVVDGNVSRVLSRYYGIGTPVNSTEGKKTFSELAAEILDHNNPGQHNQALMELGAIVCFPKNPLCGICPLKENCNSLISGSIALFPKKIKKQIVRDRFFNYLLIKKGNTILIRQRQPGDIWTMLYEFPLIETDVNTNIEGILRDEQWKNYFKGLPYKITSISKTFDHKLTHQRISTRFLEVEVEKNIEIPYTLEVEIIDLQNYAFPRVIDKYLEHRKNRKDTL